MAAMRPGGPTGPSEPDTGPRVASALKSAGVVVFAVTAMTLPLWAVAGFMPSIRGSGFPLTLVLLLFRLSGIAAGAIVFARGLYED